MIHRRCKPSDLIVDEQVLWGISSPQTNPFQLVVLILSDHPTPTVVTLVDAGVTFNKSLKQTVCNSIATPKLLTQPGGGLPSATRSWSQAKFNSADLTLTQTKTLIDRATTAWRTMLQILAKSSANLTTTFSGWLAPVAEGGFNWDLKRLVDLGVAARLAVEGIATSN